MDEQKRKEIGRDFWRFMIIGSQLNSIFYLVIKGYVAIERLPFRYFLIAGVASWAVLAILYFAIRNWPGRWKTGVVWLISFTWLGFCLMYGR